jgi:hypothetical protein
MLLLVPNISATVNLTTISNKLDSMQLDIDEIQEELAGLPKETYLYFQTVEETLQHNNDSCIANGTIHRKEILVENVWLVTILM